MYYETHKDQQLAYNKVYHNEKVECNICGKTITRKTMFKHKDLPSCKAIANVCKFYSEMLDNKHKYDIYSLGKTKLQEIMHGEFNGGIKLTDEEKKGQIRFYENRFGVRLKDIMNLIIATMMN